MERQQKQAITRDLDRKMVLLAGPRQAGKTTLALEIGKTFNHTVYLTYDRAEDRKIIQEESWLDYTDLLILDEIHKMPNWKNYLKGVFDTKPKHQKILVTGSARLEIFNQLGDSLAGRYFLHRLLPFSPSELEQVGAPPDLDRLLERGGFPKPFLEEDPVNAKRWRLQYIDSLLRTDLLEFETIHHLKAIRLIFDLLRERVGSPISFTSIAEDVSISPNTVKKYINILEALYVIFKVTPFSNNIARSLLKEPKIYFFDTGLVKGGPGPKFENLVAVSLLKHVLLNTDYKGEEDSLHYLRTKDGREVDFALVRDHEIQRILELKLSNHNINRSLVYFHKKYQLPGTQIVKDLKQERKEGDIDIVDAKRFLKEL